MEIIKQIPQILNNDLTAKAMIECFDETLILILNNIDKILLYDNINNLNEKVLDSLAYQHHVDYYDYNADRIEKINVIKSSINIHKYKGSVYAVKESIKSIFGAHANLIEWFDYNGEPFHFKVEVAADIVNINDELQNKAINAINKSKNARSILDNIYWVLPKEETIKTYVGINVQILKIVRI